MSFPFERGHFGGSFHYFKDCIGVNDFHGGQVLDDKAVSSKGFSASGSRAGVGDVPLELFHNLEAAGVHDIQGAVLCVVFVEGSLDTFSWDCVRFDPELFSVST
jgi:hypothetical protein